MSQQTQAGTDTQMGRADWDEGKEIVHKSDRFTFSHLSTLKCRFQIQRHTGQIWRQTSEKRSENENFSPDLFFLDVSKIEDFSLRK